MNRLSRKRQTLIIHLLLEGLSMAIENVRLLGLPGEGSRVTEAGQFPTLVGGGNSLPCRLLPARASRAQRLAC